MPDYIEVTPLKCSDCESSGLVVIGIHKGWIYFQCLECEAYIKWELTHLDQTSHLVKTDDEQLRFKLPDDKGGNGETDW